MLPYPDDSAARDTALHDVIRAYLEAVDAGHPPDRSVLLLQHPQLADELAAFFADQDQASRAARAMQFEATAVHLQQDSPSDAATSGLSAAPELSLSRPQHIRYFGDYELLSEIARGGMGVVYKARQAKLDRIVAVKMILAGQLASPAEVARFHSEAQAAAKLDHPGIVPIHEVGQHESQHYFSMGYVAGQSLLERLATGPLPPRTGAELLRVVALAVHYAHGEGIIHRDLKPSNILLDLKANRGSPTLDWRNAWGATLNSQRLVKSSALPVTCRRNRRQVLPLRSVQLPMSTRWGRFCMPRSPVGPRFKRLVRSIRSCRFASPILHRRDY